MVSITLLSLGVVITMTVIAILFFYQGYRFGLGKRLLHLTISVGVFVIDDLGRFLFYRRSDGLLSVVAGGVFAWEHPEATVRREWFEETGLNADFMVLKLLGIIDIHPVITGEMSQAYGIGYVANYLGQLPENGFLWLDKEDIVAMRNQIYKPEPFTLHFIKRYGMKPLLPLTAVSQIGFDQEKYEKEKKSLPFRLFKMIHQIIYKAWPPQV